MKERFIFACMLIHRFTLPMLLSGLVLLIVFEAAPIPYTIHPH